MDRFSIQSYVWLLLGMYTFWPVQGGSLMLHVVIVGQIGRCVWTAPYIHLGLSILHNHIHYTSIHHE